MKPLVSVIIPTRDSGRTLETCLKSVSEQTWQNTEIVVVDAYSSDNTVKIASKFGAKISQVKALRSMARNIGAEKAVGSLLLFLDADMELDPEVLQCCVEKVRDNCDAVIIPETSVGEGFWARCKALEKTCYIGDDLIEAARLFKRPVFENIGGYDPKLEAGEDWDLNQRTKKAGYRIGRIDAFIKHHEGRLSLRETVTKKHYYGLTLEHYRKKHPEEASLQLRLIRPAFVRNQEELTKDPAHAVGMLFMKACEFTARFLAAVKSKGSRKEG